MTLAVAEVNELLLRISGRIFLIEKYFVHLLLIDLGNVQRLKINNRNLEQKITKKSRTMTILPLHHE